LNFAPLLSNPFALSTALLTGVSEKLSMHWQKILGPKAAQSSPAWMSGEFEWDNTA
jgi:hypothetical protein